MVCPKSLTNFTTVLKETVVISFLTDDFRKPYVKFLIPNAFHKSVIKNLILDNFKKNCLKKTGQELVIFL